VASPALTALVPATNIVDRHGRPAAFPSVILGEGQEVDAEVSFDRRHVRIYTDLHLWDRSPALTSVKAIAGAIRQVLHGAELALDEGRLLDLRVVSSRHLRDPDGVTAHSVVTIEALIEEARP
jgi:hypothetical protein